MLCTLCPRRCGVDRSQTRGFCGLGTDLRIARIAPHLWEEPPISGSRGTGAVFFSGCTLRCAFCQNGEISHQNAGRDFSPRTLADSLKRLEDLGVHTISFITGTPFVPQILEALSLYRPALPLVWNSSGYESVETLKKLEGVIDVYLPDLKHFSPRMGALCAKAPDYFEAATRAIREMCRQTGLPMYNEEGIMTRGTLVRHLILPSLTGESMKLLTWIRDTLPAGTPSVSCVSICPATMFRFQRFSAELRRRNISGCLRIWRLSDSPDSCRRRKPPPLISCRSLTGTRALYSPPAPRSRRAVCPLFESAQRRACPKAGHRKNGKTVPPDSLPVSVFGSHSPFAPVWG